MLELDKPCNSINFLVGAINSLKSFGLSDKLINISPSKIFKLHLFKDHSSLLKSSFINLADFIDPSKL